MKKDNCLCNLLCKHEHVKFQTAFIYIHIYIYTINQQPQKYIQSIFIMTNGIKSKGVLRAYGKFFPTIINVMNKIKFQNQI